MRLLLLLWPKLMTLLSEFYCYICGGASDIDLPPRWLVIILIFYSSYLWLLFAYFFPDLAELSFDDEGL